MCEIHEGGCGNWRRLPGLCPSVSLEKTPLNPLQRLIMSSTSSLWCENGVNPLHTVLLAMFLSQGSHHTLKEMELYKERVFFQWSFWTCEEELVSNPEHQHRLRLHCQLLTQCLSLRMQTLIQSFVKHQLSPSRGHRNPERVSYMCQRLKVGK